MIDTRFTHLALLQTQYQLEACTYWHVLLGPGAYLTAGDRMLVLSCRNDGRVYGFDLVDLQLAGHFDTSTISAALSHVQTNPHNPVMNAPVRTVRLFPCGWMTKAEHERLFAAAREKGLVNDDK